MKDRYVKLGHCGRPHGVKGGFSFQLETGGDTILTKGMPILLVGKNKTVEEGQTFTIKSISGAPKVIVYLEEVNNRSQVEEILPVEIYLHRDHFPEADEDEIYLNDLISLDVRDINSGESLGIVHAVYDHGAHPILSLKLKSGELTDVPFIEHFVPEIDLENGYIKVLLPEVIE